MTVKMRTTAAGPKGILLNGMVYDLDDDFGGSLVQGRAAVAGRMVGNRFEPEAPAPAPKSEEKKPANAKK